MTNGGHMFKKNLLTIILITSLIIFSLISIFVGALEINVSDLFNNDPQQWQLLFVSRLPRLLAIICTGCGMSVAGLIMQQLCMNKFVSPSTGATISSAQLGILIALLFLPNSNLYTRSLFAFVFCYSRNMDICIFHSKNSV